jgi:hypothetical protein
MTLSITMLYYDECHYAECHYVECRYAECRYTECRSAEQGCLWINLDIIISLNQK